MEILVDRPIITEDNYGECHTIKEFSYSHAKITIDFWHEFIGTGYGFTDMIMTIKNKYSHPIYIKLCNYRVWFANHDVVQHHITRGTYDELVDDIREYYDQILEYCIKKIKFFSCIIKLFLLDN